MTRINVVPPKELTSAHLVAEYREILRLPNLVRRRVEAGYTPERIKAPEHYTLGTGHVKFFYDKLLWISERHIALVNEMKRRGYSPQFTDNMRHTHRDIPGEWWGDWGPDKEALRINRERISVRLAGSSKQPSGH
jgi:deoxyribonuclease (pyrimidine dimer)